MTRPVPAAIGAFAAGLLDAMTNADIGYMIFLHRGVGQLEKWHANEVALRHLGYTVEEWLAMPTFGIIAPDQRERFAALSDRHMSAGPIPSFIEVTVIHRDGHALRVELAIARVEVPEGHALIAVMPYLGFQMQLLEADRVALVGALAVGFAHETNNPLTSVLLNLRSLRKQLVQHLSPAAQTAALRCLDDITTGAERIASNVRAFQTLASRSVTQNIDLAAVVSAVLRLALPTLESRAHVVRQISPVRPVAGEESRIGQAVLAMLLFSSSGFEVATDGNRIVVAVEERDGSVIVEVSDNGHELADDEASHAFDPFFRSPTRGAGVGVGLGVARSIAVALNGTVSLAPRPEGGAVITMKLPPAP